MCSGRAGAVPGPGSGNWFRELVPGTSFGNGIRVSMGSDRFCGSKVPVQSGSEGCVKEVSKVSVFDGFRGVRFCSRGFDGTVSGNRVPGTRAIKKVPGQGFRQYFESILLYFESVLLYFESMLLYVESILVVLCKYNFLR